MLLLVSGATRTVMQLRVHPNMGVLTSPRGRHSKRYIASTGLRWAMDNDAYTRDGFNPSGYMDRLYALRNLPRCLFVCCPDVVGDASATLANFVKWGSWVKYVGYPVALVAQDGLESHSIPWGQFDALFIGGSTEWKLSAIAAEIVSEAKSRAKWVHMGRVNSIKRIRYAQKIGCDSVDGTGYSIKPIYIRKHLPTIETAQLAMF